MDRRRRILTGVLVTLGALGLLAVAGYALVMLKVVSFGRQAPPAPTAPAQTAVPTSSEVQGHRARFQSGDVYLAVEFLDDDLVHFELSPQGPEPALDEPLPTSPMVAKTDYAGPGSLVSDGHGTLETPALRVQVDAASLCITVTDLAREPDLRLTTLCPRDLEKEIKALQIDPAGFSNVYGLGEQFPKEASADGDWTGRIRIGGDFGNVQETTDLGNVGNDQFPIAYFLGQGDESYALFLDSGNRQVWNLQQGSWRAAARGERLRFYILAGPDLADLRQDYLELTGRPPVPPRKAFGLWISEYGFDNWAELEDKLRTLRENQFPVDGFVLDLPWYGGITEASDDTRMGSLTWDEESFPNPAAEIARLRDEEGIGLIAIEQPYVGKNLPEHATLAEKGYLVREGCATCEPVYLTKNPWWGQGGMIDWSNTAARDFWHDWKRDPLIEAGLIGHWTDLGEPELYSKDGWYAGVPGDEEPLQGEADVHNLYNLLWAQGIYEGYARNGETQRPWILSRSGTSGIQRYGAALWSGDIGSSLDSLTAHLNVQMQMSLSGVDYYGADIGGFWRSGGDLEQSYTLWFANGMALDVPGRVHTFNLCNCNETAPDRIGDPASNLANVRQRYELIPYVYSLAHRAYLYGEPLEPPLVYAFQDDPAVRTMGNEKMVGPSLLVATASDSGEYARTVYLPAGTWVDYHTGQWYSSTGQELGPFALYPDGLFRLPALARAGAIIPQMYVDEQTMDAFGRRLDGTTRDELIVRVYADAQESAFTLYEDDGTTIAYQRGAVRTTLLTQQLSGPTAVVQIAAASGTYAGAPEARDNVVRLYLNGLSASAVTLNGTALPRFDGAEGWEAAAAGWYDTGEGVVLARSGEMAVAEGKEFRFTLTERVEPTPGPAAEPLPAYWPTAGWQEASPEQVGMDAATLARAVDYLARQDAMLHRWLLVRQGYVVADVPFARELPAAAFPQDGATAAVLSTLVGIAIDQGAIPSVQAPVLSFFPGRAIANRDARKESMTVEDLLTMRSGLQCDPEQTVYGMVQSADWLQYTLDLPMAAEPGSQVALCETNAHLLSAVLQQATGMSALDFAQANLFAALGITGTSWTSDPQGVNMGWAGLRMDAADTAKLGLLYLRGGAWEGRQVVSAEWIAEATRGRVPLSDVSFGYLWFVYGESYFAYAPFSQWLVAIPSLDLVTVLGGGLMESDTSMVRLLAASFLGPAAQADTPLPADPAELEQLRASIAEAGREPPPQPVPPLPETAAAISGQLYTMAEEEIGLAGISLSFPGGDEAVFLVVQNDMEITLTVGLDGIRRVSTVPVPGITVLIGAKGRWESSDTFVLDLLQCLPMQRMAMEFRMTFQGDEVELVLGAEGEQATAHGQVQR